jgi:filamentous hemagglutinin
MVREGGKVLARADDAVDVVRAAGEAHDAAEAVRLQKRLASEQQVGEILSGEAKSIVGAGSKGGLRDAGRLAEQHGGKAGDWAKVRSSSFTAKDGTQFEIHAYRNTKTGQTVGRKTKLIELERLARQAGGGS